jgi:2-polyprenyl-3-methyl-5-hydroxy-6-metoxy-1,4-benzoquinol methylase
VPATDTHADRRAPTSRAQAVIREGYNNQPRLDVIPSLPENAGTVLDVGGGNGATAAHLKRLGRATRAGSVDLVPGDSADPDLDFQFVGNLEDEQFVDAVVAEGGPFDTVLCLDVLEHLRDPWRVVAQLHGGLRPGGLLVASLPNVRHYRISGGLFFRNRWVLEDAGILDRTHLRFFVRDTAVELLTHSGLALEDVRAPLPDRRRRLVQIFRKLTFGLFDSLITVRYVIRVRRPEPGDPS